MTSRVDDGSGSPRDAGGGKPARAVRTGSRDERLRRLTSGLRLGTTGAAALIASAIVAAVAAVNALTILHDAARRGSPAPAWQPFALEYSSGIALIAAYLLVSPIFRLAPPRPPWPRFALTHLAASAAFSALHVVGMVALRHAIWAARGESYAFDFAGDWFYEYRKDVIAYGAMAAITWMLARRSAAKAAPPAADATVVLHDGARRLRFDAAAILAAEASGNYVELILADGRRPLVRTTLAKAEAALSPHGFVRTHRSWLVRSDRVQAIEPTGSGDHVLRLDGGVSAPLSRRFPQALRAVRERAG